MIWQASLVARFTTDVHDWIFGAIPGTEFSWESN